MDQRIHFTGKKATFGCHARTRNIRARVFSGERTEEEKDARVRVPV
jgi:hypothetical protein